VAAQADDGGQNLGIHYMSLLESPEFANGSIQERKTTRPRRQEKVTGRRLASLGSETEARAVKKMFQVPYSMHIR